MYPPVGARPPPGFLMSEAVRADKRTDFADFRHGERVSELVPAGTLDINHFKIFPRVLQAIFKHGKIYGAIGV